MPCKAVKEFLSHHEVPFTSRVIDEDPAALNELVEKTGKRATPVILVGDEVVVGFDRAKLQSILGIGQR